MNRTLAGALAWPEDRVATLVDQLGSRGLIDRLALDDFEIDKAELAAEVERDVGQGGHAQADADGGREMVRTARLSIEAATLDMLGTARRVIITKDETTIVQGGGEHAEIEGDELVWDRSLGRARNVVKLPPGWMLTSLSVPAVITEDDEGLVSLRFINPRNDGINVVIRARKRPGS